MNVIKLHGALADKFGPEREMLVKSPREALKAMCAVVTGFHEEFVKHNYRVARVKPGSQRAILVDEDTFGIKTKSCEIHFIPVPEGSKSGPLKILTGIALVGLTIVTAGAAAPLLAGNFAAAGAALGGVAFAGITYGTLALFGAAIALSGLALTLAPSPQGVDPNDQEEQPASFLFNGVVNVSAQGHPKPLVFGRHMTGSLTASASLRIVQIAVYSGSPYYDNTGGGFFGNIAARVLNEQ